MDNLFRKQPQSNHIEGVTRKPREVVVDLALELYPYDTTLSWSDQCATELTRMRFIKEGKKVIKLTENFTRLSDKLGKGLPPTNGGENI
jgi:hypothetical protein